MSTNDDLPPLPEPAWIPRMPHMPYSHGQMQAYAREAVAADRARRAAPEGWQLVPKIPTLGMFQHGIRKAREFPTVPLRLTPIYAAMLAAAPLPKEQT